MILSVFYPSTSRIEQFLDREALQDYTYPEVGASRGKEPEAYDNDHNFIYLGKGTDTWEIACEVLRQWQHFPRPWTRIHPADRPPTVGQNVAVLFQLWGTWWTNSARIVYVIDEADKYGFAYGTLPGHLEKGEECFWVERDDTGAISYHIRAFSKPRFWLARLGYPLARFYQRRFVKQSLARVQKFCTNSILTKSTNL